MLARLCGVAEDEAAAVGEAEAEDGAGEALEKWHQRNQGRDWIATWSRVKNWNWWTTSSKHRCVKKKIPPLVIQTQKVAMMSKVMPKFRIKMKANQNRAVKKPNRELRGSTSAGRTSSKKVKAFKSQPVPKNPTSKSLFRWIPNIKLLSGKLMGQKMRLAAKVESHKKVWRFQVRSARSQFLANAYGSLPCWERSTMRPTWCSLRSPQNSSKIKFKTFTLPTDALKHNRKKARLRLRHRQKPQLKSRPKLTFSRHGTSMMRKAGAKSEASSPSTKAAVQGWKPWGLSSCRTQNGIIWFKVGWTSNSEKSSCRPKSP